MAADAPVNLTHLVIRNLDPALKLALGRSAATSGVSMEEEARQILASALAEFAGVDTSLPASLGAAMAMLFGKDGGVDLDSPPREMGCAPPDFGEAGVA